MFSMGCTKTLFVYLLITLLTLTIARRHSKKLQYDDSTESGEYEGDQRPGKRHKTGRNYRSFHHPHGERRGNGGFNVGIEDGYPIRGPVQQPFIPALPNKRGQGQRRYAEPHTNFQYPANNFQQTSIKFPQHPRPPTQSVQEAPNNLPYIANNYQNPVDPQNNFHQPPIHGYQHTADNIQQPSIKFPQHPGPQSFQGAQHNLPPVPPNNFQQQQPANNFPLTMNNYDQGPQTNIAIQANPSNNGPIQQPQLSVNPFVSNKQNPHAFEAVTNELSTTVQPTDTTPSYDNPRRMDLLYGSNILEEDQKLNGKTTPLSFDDRGLFDTAPHCQDDHILVNNKCRLKV